VDTRKTVAIASGIAVAVIIVAAAFGLNVANRSIVGSALLIATLAISLQLVFGILGELSLGQSVLFGIGAYAYALAAMHGAPVLVAVLAGIVASILAGAIMGLMLSKVQGAYFAVITYAIGVLLGVVAGGLSFVGGSEGLLGVPQLPVLFPGSTGTGPLIYIGGAFVVSIALLYFAWRSPIGLTLEVTRADRRVARSLGVNTTMAVLAAMVLSAIPAALAGVAFAGTGLYVGPSVFSFYYITIPLAVIAIGGTRSLLGSLTGGIIIIAIPLALNINPLTVQVAAGILLAVVVIALPSGINHGLLSLARYLARLIRPPKEARPQLAQPTVTDESAPAAPGGVPQQDRGVLEARAVSVRFGGLHAVDDADLQVAAGEIVGLIGPNGAGKSTLVGALCGAVNVASGSVVILGADVTGASDYRRARLGLARTFQDVALVQSLTVRQNFVVAQAEGRFVRHGLRLPPLSAGALEAVRGFGLADFLEAKVSGLDNLTRRVLAVALAMASRPRFLLLDEATAGLSRQDRQEFIRVIRAAVAAHGIGVLVIEHDVEFVSQLCSRVVVMNEGRVIANAAPDDVLKAPEVIASYLGKGWKRAST
jgi:ABC-type branched-subunit amino acid transport system ATPase component/ABC-type branched-subunit amino acid transport system permease subunit